jgi:hypothetical protein
MMTDNEQSEGLLEGLMPRKEWARQALNRCDRTAKRLQDAGMIVVVTIGKQPFVDIKKTAARIRGDDQPKRKRAA